MKTFLGYLGWIMFYVVSILLVYIAGICTMLKLTTDAVKDLKEDHKKSFDPNSYRTWRDSMVK